jgi:hypothetical protein
MARTARDPRLLTVFAGAVLSGVVGAVAIAETGSWLVMALTIGAILLLGLAIVLDVSGAVEGRSRYTPARPSPDPPPRAAKPESPGVDYRGPEARHRLLVMTSEPLPAERILEAVTRWINHSVARAALGVMVVSPEGFGAHEIMDDEGRYEAARRAEGETVASLRKASVKAAGHVGDHDAAQALADALALFPAERVLVFAHPGYADAYRQSIDPATLRLPVEIVEVPAPRAREFQHRH